jgi:AAA15 family ATPase/GTPase
VGKTALLEAFYLTYDEFSETYDEASSLILIPLIEIMRNRSVTKKTLKHNLSIIKYNVKINDKILNSLTYKNKYYLNDEEKKEFEYLNQDYSEFLVIKTINTLDLIPIHSISLEKDLRYNGIYINSSKPTNTRLVELYSEIQTKGVQHKFLKYLQILDKNIAWIEPQLIQEEMFLRINLENPEYSLLSSELGEGTNRFIQILAVILTNKDGMVFIDEIENGLHYSRLYDIWKAIIEIVRQENVQLFVTTHDKESMEALHKASVDSDFDEITSIELHKDETNKIVPIVMEYENFSLGLKMGEDFRG